MAYTYNRYGLFIGLIVASLVSFLVFYSPFSSTVQLKSGTIKRLNGSIKSLDEEARSFSHSKEPSLPHLKDVPSTTPLTIEQIEQDRVIQDIVTKPGGRLAARDDVVSPYKALGLSPPLNKPENVQVPSLEMINYGKNDVQKKIRKISDTGPIKHDLKEATKLSQEVQNQNFEGTSEEKLGQVPVPFVGGSYKEDIIPDDPYHGQCYIPPAEKQVTHPMSASDIAKKLNSSFVVSSQTETDIAEAINLNIVSINQSEADNIKVILGYHGYEDRPFYVWFNFTSCRYTNCIALNPHRSPQHPMAPEDIVSYSSIILFNLVEMYQGATLGKIPRKQQQYFGVTSLESTGYFYNLMPSALDGKINMTLTYNRASTVPEWHIFKACISRRPQYIPAVNYAAGKTKGAIAYVSNCYSMQYNRLNVMQYLKKYIPVDIFGRCGNPDPCAEEGDQCRAKLHSSYRFYLAFENSLCVDYISEKFWDRLSEDAFLLPVAMGGLSVDEYSQQTPVNSFLHLRNFTDVEGLGNFLKILMTDDEKYNSYHRWRESWQIFKRPIYSRFPACDLCRIANEKPYMPAKENLSAEYNKPEYCSDMHHVFDKI